MKPARIWTDIKRRCLDPTYKWYADYGGRGVGLYEPWQEDRQAFVDYILALPDASPGRSLDRTDNDLGYTPGNLRWATPGEQVRNRRKNRNNTSGTNGVTWYWNASGGTRAIAWWFPLDGGHAKSKSFPEKRYGLLPAYAMAVEHRRTMIDKLNKAGAGYSAKHGR